uniref:helix-turn-helix domain-containing protein n=1 Tax=Paraburkholderia sp. RL17-337-BIB-A TaxID=3031636 RepID=UPI0038B74781
MHAPPAPAANGKVVGSPPAAVTRDDVLRALERNGNNRAAASRALGIGRTALWRLLKK